MRHTAMLTILACLLSACGDTPQPIAPLTQAERDALTPAEAIMILKEGNARFLKGEYTPRHDLSDVRATATGQSPLVAVLGCIDSRVPPRFIFDGGIGDSFVAGVAGNCVTVAVLGSLEYSCAVAGAKVVLVLGHTGCGAVKGACDGVELGNLTALLAKIRPAVDEVPDDGSDRTSGNKVFVDRVALQNVRLVLRQIRKHSPTLANLENEGKIAIVGAMYDVATGKVEWLDDE